MQTRIIKPINFIYFRAETTVNELHSFLPVAQHLFIEAAKLNVAITGPVHWHYFNFMGDVTKPFTLEISIPVAEIPSEYDGNYHFKRTDSYKCVSLIHEGGWLEIPKTYEKLMQHVFSNNLVPSGNNRELYINADFKNAEANITEVQLGVV